jgi:soluble lytic murein transglycosylase
MKYFRQELPGHSLVRYVSGCTYPRRRNSRSAQKVGALKIVSIPFFFILFGLVSCEAEPAVLDIDRKEAAQRLQAGNVAFILAADASMMRQIADIHPSAPFYAGLLTKAIENEPKLHTAALFVVALDAPSNRIQSEAAGELMVLALEDAEIAASVLDALEQKPDSVLKAAALYRLERFDEALKTVKNTPGSGENNWGRALSLLTTMKSGGAVSSGLLEFFLSGAVENVHKWAYGEVVDGVLFAVCETAAIEGRFAAARSAYGEGARHFRTAFSQSRELFFQYPDVLTDLGRCFQYTGPAEGTKLFLEWDDAVRAGRDTERSSLIRYRLLFFAGRMARQRERWIEAAAYFAGALPFAPDKEQEDSCMWYHLDVTRKDTPEKLLPLLSAYAPRWSDPAYFSDILDELCRYLTAKHNWTKMLEVFSLMKKPDNRFDRGSVAKFAYIIGRVIDEGYVPLAEVLALTATDGGSRSFFRITFDETGASLYYRALSASYLGEAVEMPKRRGKEAVPNVLDNAESDDAAFIMGFFQFGASAYAVSYLKPLVEKLPIPALQAIAKALSDDGQWQETIRLITSYVNRAAYTPDYTDMALYYPQPFQDIIEAYAQLSDVPEALLFGLVRTESAFKADVVSSAGAIGLSQLMKVTAIETAERIRRQGGPDYFETGLTLEDPEVNVHIGSFYLGYLIGRMDSPLLALLAYNGGPTRIRRLREADTTLPDDLFLETISITETREYGKRVAAAAAAYAYLYYGLNMETIVADILRKR